MINPRLLVLVAGASVAALHAQSLSSLSSSPSFSGGSLTLSSPAIYTPPAPALGVSGYEVSETVPADTLRVTFRVTRKRPDAILALEWSDAVINSVNAKLKEIGVEKTESVFETLPVPESAPSSKSSSGIFGGDKTERPVNAYVQFSVPVPLKGRTAAGALVAARKAVEAMLNKEEMETLAYTGVAYELADPEALRAALVTKIAARAAETRILLSKDADAAARHRLDFEISGLESKVSQRVSDSGRVTVFLPYTMRWRTVADPVK